MPMLQSLALELCITLYSKRDIVDGIKFMDFWIRILSWIVWVDPMLSHGPLKVEEQGRRVRQRDAMEKET